MELSEVNWFSGGRGEDQHMHGHCSSSLGCSFFQIVDFCLPGIVMMRTGTLPPSKLPCYFSDNSVCSVGALRQCFQELHYQAPRSPLQREISGCVVLWASLWVWFQGSRAGGFCTVDKAKMLFTFLNGYKQTKNQNTKKNMR